MKLDCAPMVIGIDIGGTKIAASLITKDGLLAGQCLQMPTPAQEGPETMLAQISELIESCRRQVDDDVIYGIGIGSAGVISADGRHIISATSAIKDWAQTPIADRLEQSSGLGVIVENDVHAHARGEAWRGAGQGIDNLLLVAIGTGIGGAQVLAGQVVRGSRGLAGHFGHLASRYATNRPCTCGARSAHLEAIASGPGVVDWYRERGGNAQIATAWDLEKAALAGDELAYQVYSEAGLAIGQMIGSLVNCLDPQCVIIGGSLAKSATFWWDHLRTGIKEEAIALAGEIALLRPALGSSAALIGAGKLAWDHLENTG